MSSALPQFYQMTGGTVGDNANAQPEKGVPHCIQQTFGPCINTLKKGID